MEKVLLLLGVMPASNVLRPSPLLLPLTPPPPLLLLLLDSGKRGAKTREARLCTTESKELRRGAGSIWGLELDLLLVPEELLPEISAVLLDWLINSLMERTTSVSSFSSHRMLISLQQEKDFF